MTSLPDISFLNTASLALYCSWMISSSQDSTSDKRGGIPYRFGNCRVLRSFLADVYDTAPSSLVAGDSGSVHWGQLLGRRSVCGGNPVGRHLAEEYPVQPLNKMICASLVRVLPGPLSYCVSRRPFLLDGAIFVTLRLPAQCAARS